MGYDLKLRVWRGDEDGGELVDYTVGVEESSSTRFTGCRPPRPAISPSAGTARPANAAPAVPRSTVALG
jgi:hypothetical protein